MGENSHREAPQKEGFSVGSLVGALCVQSRGKYELSFDSLSSVWSLWEGLIYVLGLFWVCPFEVKDLLLEWTSFLIRKNDKKKPSMVVSFSLIWAIWNKINCSL